MSKAEQVKTVNELAGKYLKRKTGLLMTIRPKKKEPRTARPACALPKGQARFGWLQWLQTNG